MLRLLGVSLTTVLMLRVAFCQAIPALEDDRGTELLGVKQQLGKLLRGLSLVNKRVETLKCEYLYMGSGI